MDFQGGKNANALFARVNGLTELKTQNSPKRLKTAPKKKCRGGGGGGLLGPPQGLQPTKSRANKGKQPKEEQN
jgi:hypothetical protein